MMYQKGLVTQNRVVAYALYSLSAAADPSSTNNAPENRTALASEMTKKMLVAAKSLTSEMGRRGNLLMAIDAYVKNPSVKEAAEPLM
jgi:hypothetical protein